MADPRFIRTGDVNFALAHASEECGELMVEVGGLVAAIGKTQRWGLDSVNPLLPPAEQEANRDWVRRQIDGVRREVSDLIGALDRLEAELSRKEQG